MESGSDIFYYLARSADNTEDRGWTYWRDPIGTKGTRTVTFTTGDSDDYCIYWGIHGGALSLDDIIITQLQTSQYDSSGRLVQVRQSDNKVSKYYFDSNGNLISVKTE